MRLILINGYIAFLNCRSQLFAKVYSMRSRFSPVYLIVFIAILFAMMLAVQFGIITFTFQKLGLSANTAFLLLIGCLGGSVLNIPLFRIETSPGPEYIESIMHGLLRSSRIVHTGFTVIAINVGGCVIPLVFSLYLIFWNRLDLLQVFSGIAIVTMVSYLFSRPIAGLGIGMPFLIAPLTAALVAILINNEQSAPLAYITGTLGVLIGADILHLHDIRKIGSPFASIGGAGTFDGIFLTGLIAVLLA